MSLVTELPTSHHLAKDSSPEIPEVGSDRQWVIQQKSSPTGTTPLKKEENKMDASGNEKPSIFDTWVASAKLQEAAQQLRSTPNSNTTNSSNALNNDSFGSQPNDAWHSKRQHNKPGQYKLGQCKGISKVRLVGDPNVESLEARVAERRTADKLRDEKIRKKIHAMFVERVHRETEREELKKAEAEAEHRAKQEEFRRKHEEHLAAEEARKVRCSKLLKCDMDIIKGKKSVTARFEGRKAELKKIEDEDLLIAKWQRHETCATGKNFYDKLHEHQVTVKAKVEADALDRTSRKLDMPPLPAEYRNKVRDQFLRLESQRKAEIVTETRGSDLNRTLSQGKRSNMIQYAQATQRELLPTLQTVPMVFEEEKKTVPRESMTAQDRKREGNMAIHHHPSRSASTSPSTSPQQTPLGSSLGYCKATTASSLTL